MPSPFMFVELFNGRYSARVRALVDTGASAPIFDLGVARQLQLPISQNDTLVLAEVFSPMAQMST